MHSKDLHINFVSATMSQKVEELGTRMMESYVKVGFGEHIGETTTATEQDDTIASIPKQVHQYFSMVPTQYRLVYLLAFLYAHQNEKIIIFVSNCELANFIA